MRSPEGKGVIKTRQSRHRGTPYGSIRPASTLPRGGNEDALHRKREKETTNGTGKAP